ncbi:hypothetical protein M758_9G111900 [Ceratodon purpureus]|nr:hypothetical protein M758_9G111900 [Ceratodon purpureus]
MPQSASSGSASAPDLKRHLLVPTLKSTKGISARASPQTSSSFYSSSQKSGLNGGKAISNRKLSQGTKDATANARVSSPESSAEITGAKFESSNKPNEAKHITGNAEPSLLISQPRLKDLSSQADLNVVHTNLVETWFNVDDPVFDDFVNIKADIDPHKARSEKQNSLGNSLLIAAEATANLGSSLQDNINNSCVKELIEGAIGVKTTFQLDEKNEDGIAPGKAVVEGLNSKIVPDVTVCYEAMQNSLKYEDGSTLLEKLAVRGKALREIRQACANQLRRTNHGIHVFRGWRGMKFLLPSSYVVVLSILLIFVNFFNNSAPDVHLTPT